jgi:hypothetical protein
LKRELTREAARIMIVIGGVVPSHDFEAPTNPARRHLPPGTVIAEAAGSPARPAPAPGYEPKQAAE